MAKIIGLTGPIGAGKSTVARILSEKGCVIIDCDKISREIVEPNSPTLSVLVKEFGNTILNTDGSLNRAALAEIALSTEENQKKLNSITHPAIIKIALSRATKALNEGKSAIVEATLLFESGANMLCNASVAVIAPKEERIKRVALRDKLDEKAINLKINAQKEESYYAERADFVIKNYPPFDINEELQPLFEYLGI